ncbi:unnamed protein product [Caenorhabditis auriculariae]|uniref:Hexosyltransferase n=1 Tax=Caenorhabditis auriculariae TaxID=2777116 RepID=A0A8S1HKM4_9PELO|nr:unnamed protein product [Caenorhabditis auriculariae]
MTISRKTILLLSITIALWIFYTFHLLHSKKALAEEEKATRKEVVFKNVHKTYRLLISPNDSQCSRNPKVLVVVLSTADSYDMRQAIRKTYGNPKISKSVAEGKAVINFIMSQPKSHGLMRNLSRENSTYNDIIVTDLPEDYNLLHLKVYALLDFYRENCLQADFVLKIDHDVALDVDRMLYFIDKDAKTNSMSISGIVWHESMARRDPTDKWYITKEEWAGFYYPPYCDGPFYLIGRSAAQRLLIHAKTTHAFRFEDVLFTGIIAQKAKVHRNHWMRHLVHAVVV